MRTQKLVEYVQVAFRHCVTTRKVSELSSEAPYRRLSFLVLATTRGFDNTDSRALAAAHAKHVTRTPTASVSDPKVWIACGSLWLGGCLVSHQNGRNSAQLDADAALAWRPSSARETVNS